MNKAVFLSVSVLQGQRSVGSFDVKARRRNFFQNKLEPIIYNPVDKVQSWSSSIPATCTTPPLSISQQTEYTKEPKGVFSIQFRVCHKNIGQDLSEKILGGTCHDRAT